MKRFFYPLFMALLAVFFNTAIGASLEYQNQRRSLYQWDRIDVNKWSDFDIWKEQLEIKEKNPDWERVLRENRLKEAVARVLHCVGTCKVETGAGNSTASHRSVIFEEEDIVTSKDSYLWLYVLNGGMVRLSPETSVTMKEINIGEKENFVHLRVNYGNALWLNRFEYELADNDTRETDMLFVPVDLYEANVQPRRIKVDEQNIFGYVEEVLAPKKRYFELNEMIAKNNAMTKKKPTRIMISTSSATVTGTDKTIEVVALTGGSTFVHVRDFVSQGVIADASFDGNLSVDYRGFEKDQSSTVDFSEWIEFPNDGRSSKNPNEEDLYKLHVSEFPSKHIPTILIAREMWLKKYSSHFFDPEIDPLYLAKMYGYRLWSDVELDLREKFLRIYVRRLETTNLLNTQQAIKQLIAASEPVRGSKLTAAFYSRAINKYRKVGDTLETTDDGLQDLNSTRRLLWKKMHARKE